ncbi:purine permease 3-like, partial [Asparagus officinalis]|uniref:purine permease 3-like n=1 Tax=Asparagus officinalis TaxID=4686 RepID=UPI00098E2AF6
SCIQTAGFPVILTPLPFSYLVTGQNSNPHLPAKSRTRRLTLPPLLATAFAGVVLIGLSDFLYTYGTSFLPVSAPSLINSTQLGFTAVFSFLIARQRFTPYSINAVVLLIVGALPSSSVSTSSLLISTQLGFTALFAFLVVRQKFTAFSINAVALLSFGALVLGIQAKGDRPRGVSRGQYYLGFVMMLGTAALYGLVLPLVELVYRKVKGTVTFTLVMEMQFVMGLFATLFCVVGMIVNKDFQAIQQEAKNFKSGETSYYMVLIWSAIFSQFFYLGIIGVIHYTSALLSGIILAVLVPVIEILAVIFFNESFNGGKGVALALSIWGFVSYFYGEYKVMKKHKALAVEPSVDSNSST